MKVLLGVLTAAMFAGCQADPVPSPSDSSNVPASAPASPDLSAVWGPLAVALDPAQGGLDAGTGPGLLDIGPRCVSLINEEVGVATTLIWRSGETRWDAQAGEIVYRDRDLGLLRLSQGDRLMLGGANLADPDSPDQGASQPIWLVEPDPTCPDERWVVMSVRPAR